MNIWIAIQWWPLKNWSKYDIKVFFSGIFYIEYIGAKKSL